GRTHRHALGLADGALFAEFGAAAKFAGLLVVTPLLEFLDDPTAFEQLLEAPQRRMNRFAVVNPHPESHASSSNRLIDVRASHYYRPGVIPAVKIRESPGDAFP